MIKIGLLCIIVICAILGSMLREPFANVVTPHYTIFQNQVDDKKRRDDYVRFVPSYVSRDIYKDIGDKEKRHAKLLEDLFYLFDIAIAHYLNDKASIENDIAKSLPVLVFAKFVSDYEYYIDIIPREKIDAAFTKRYENIPSALEVLAFLRKAGDTYKLNRAKYDAIIFAGVGQEMPLIVPISNFAKKQSSVSSAIIAMPSVAVSTGVAKTVATVANIDTVFQERASGHEEVRDLISLYKIAIETLVKNKEMYYQVYKTRKTDADFLNIPSFKPILEYVKYLEDNRENLNMNPSEFKATMDTVFPNFTTDSKYFVQGLHIQTFLLIASNLYLYSANETNRSLTS